MESFDDIELAAYSKWFGIYFTLNRELCALIERYQQNHPNEQGELALLLEEEV